LDFSEIHFENTFLLSVNNFFSGVEKKLFHSVNAVNREFLRIVRL